MKSKENCDDKKYVWKVSNNEKLQFWNKGSTQCYLSHPTQFVPDNIVKTGLKSGIITAPPESNFDPMSARGVISAGLATHKKGYYHYRKIENFAVVMFSLGGSIREKFDDKIKDLETGEMILIPAGKKTDESVLKTKADLFWLNIKMLPPWSETFGDKIVVKKAKYYGEIVGLARIYKKFVYEVPHNAAILDSLAAALLETIRNEFSEPIKDSCQTRAVVRTINAALANLKNDSTAAASAKKLGLSINTFEKICVKNFGMNFSKRLLEERMRKARELLATTSLTTVEIANQIGYATAFSFSKAFKNFNQMSPSKFKESVGNK